MVLTDETFVIISVTRFIVRVHRLKVAKELEEWICITNLNFIIKKNLQWKHEQFTVI